MKEMIKFDEKTKVLTLGDKERDFRYHSKYRVVNGTLEYYEMYDKKFYPVAYFNDFTLGELYTIAQMCGDFNVDNDMLGTFRMYHKIQYNGILGENND
tara:strand:+ start:187 stop:480 length:294 start_codon:yes stop_codon:yes gene_type:complete